MNLIELYGPSTLMQRRQRDVTSTDSVYIVTQAPDASRFGVIKIEANADDPNEVVMIDVDASIKNERVTRVVFDEDMHRDFAVSEGELLRSPVIADGRPLIVCAIVETKTQRWSDIDLEAHHVTDTYPGLNLAIADAERRLKALPDPQLRPPGPTLA